MAYPWMNENHAKERRAGMSAELVPVSKMGFGCMRLSLLDKEQATLAKAATTLRFLYQYSLHGVQLLHEGMLFERADSDCRPFEARGGFARVDHWRKRR